MVAVHKIDQRILCATGFNEQSIPNKGIYEIGYWLHKAYYGQGLVSEYVIALTKFAFLALSAKQVRICTKIDNARV
jgi:RimJ/RimL family protein N-acetyltransferase